MDAQARTKRLRGMAVCLPLLAALVLPAAASANDVWTISEDTRLSGDYTGSIFIDTGGVTLDCAGHAVIGDGSGAGIAVDGVSDVTITGCAVRGFEEGIRIEAGARNRVLSSRVSGNAAFGIIVFEAAGTLLRGNVARDNVLIGMALSGAPATVIDGNLVAGNGEGISVDNSDGALVSRNTLLDNVDAGLHAIESDNGTYVRNVAIGNGSGFTLNTAAHNSFRLNGAIGNAGVGFHAFFGSVENRFARNAACQNGLDALDASDPSGTNTWTHNLFCTPLETE